VSHIPIQRFLTFAGFRSTNNCSYFLASYSLQLPKQLTCAAITVVQNLSSQATVNMVLIEATAGRIHAVTDDTASHGSLYRLFALILQQLNVTKTKTQSNLVTNLIRHSALCLQSSNSKDVRESVCMMQRIFHVFVVFLLLHVAGQLTSFCGLDFA